MVDSISDNRMCLFKFLFLFQGPVWCLCMSGDLLFSGSSDKTVKVWVWNSQYYMIGLIIYMFGLLGVIIFEGFKRNGKKNNSYPETRIYKEQFVQVNNNTCILFFLYQIITCNYKIFSENISPLKHPDIL